MKQKEVLKQTYWYLFTLIAVVQCIGIVGYIIGNLNVLSNYKDTSEYVRMAEKLSFNAYLGVLYPLFIRLCMKISCILPLPFYMIAYILQIVIWVAACNLFVNKAVGKLERWKITVTKLFLFSIPWLGVFATAIHPLLFQVCGWLVWFVLVFSLQKSRNLYNCMLGLLGLAILQVLLVPDEFLVVLLGNMVVLLIWAIQNRDKKCLLFIPASVMLFCLAVFSFSHVLEQDGRMERNLSSTIFLKFTQPHFAKDYVCWPEEVRQVMSQDEAFQLIKREDGLILTLEERLLQSYDAKQICTFYRQMGKKAFTMHTKETVYQIRDAFFKGVLAPFTAMGKGFHNLADQSGYWYENMKDTLGRTAKYYGTISIVFLGILVVFRSFFLNYKRLLIPIGIALLQIGVMVVFGIGTQSYVNYPLSILCWYLLIVML